VTPTKEQWTIGVIARAFKHVRSIRQFRVNGYRIDLYFPDHRIAVECDELGHRRYDADAEAQRQRRIEQTLNCSFVRYNPDARGFNIGDVVNHLITQIYTC
jgi:very-short-patch-repair endonuclease